MRLEPLILGTSVELINKQNSIIIWIQDHNLAF